jgi:hypothetical protein
MNFRRNLGRHFVTVFLALVVAGSAQAHNRDYSPFAPGQHLRSFNPLNSLEAEFHNTYADVISRDALDYSPYRVMRLDYIDQTGTAVTVFDRDGQSVTGPHFVSPFGFLQAAYEGHLNSDSTIDYVIIFKSSKVGLASFQSNVVFVLSSGTSYKLTTVETWYPEKADFLDIRGDGHCQFLQTVFVDGYPARGNDGRSHNYWVYNLLEIDGETVKPANALLPGFPKWIWYSSRPNHSATRDVSEAQKRTLLTDHCLLWTPEQPCPAR